MVRSEVGLFTNLCIWRKRWSALKVAEGVVFGVSLSIYTNNLVEDFFRVGGNTSRDFAAVGGDFFEIWDLTKEGMSWGFQREYNTERIIFSDKGKFIEGFIMIIHFLKSWEMAWKIQNIIH